MLRHGDSITNIRDKYFIAQGWGRATGIATLIAIPFVLCKPQYQVTVQSLVGKVNHVTILDSYEWSVFDTLRTDQLDYLLQIILRNQYRLHNQHPRRNKLIPLQVHDRILGI